jgi:hypothetical protein
MQLRSVGYAAVAGAMLVLTACGSAVETSGAGAGDGTPSAAPEVETSAPAVPEPPKPERTGTATPIETVDLAEAWSATTEERLALFYTAIESV